MLRFLAKLVSFAFRWLACALAGHRWTISCTNLHRSGVLGHLHTMAGSDADCTRCGATWRDAKPSK